MDHNNNSMPMTNMTMPPSSMPSMHHKMMMHMTFFWGSRVEILFSGFPGDRGTGMYVLALFITFTVSVLIELLSHVPVKKKNRLLLTGLTAVRQLLSYSVMLAVMSFNVGVLIVAVVGHAVGFFAFGTGIFFKTGSSAEDEHQNGQQVIGNINKC